MSRASIFDILGSNYFLYHYNCITITTCGKCKSTTSSPMAAQSGSDCLGRELQTQDINHLPETHSETLNGISQKKKKKRNTLAALISSSNSWSRLFNLPNLLIFCWSAHVTSVSDPDDPALIHKGKQDSIHQKNK